MTSCTARSRARPASGDAGNGAAMRMLPVARFTLGDAALLDRCAREQAHLTHNHPLSDAACVCIGRLVQLAVLDRSWEQLRRVTDGLDSGEAGRPSIRYILRLGKP